VLASATAARFHIGCANMSLRRNFVFARRLPTRYVSVAARHAPCSQSSGCDTLLAKPADCGSSRQLPFPHRMLRNSVSRQHRYDFL